MLMPAHTDAHVHWGLGLLMRANGQPRTPPPSFLRGGGEWACATGPRTAYDAQVKVTVARAPFPPTIRFHTSCNAVQHT
jgi:hypothetical protein